MALWTPADLSVLPAAWIDPSDAATVTSSGGKISQVNDKSGNGRHAAQGTGSLQPSTGGSINGVAAMSYTAGNRLDILWAFTGSILNGFAVAAMSSSSAQYARLLSAANPNSGLVDYNNAATGALIDRDSNNANIGIERNNSGLVGATAVTYNTPFMALGSFTGSIMQVWKDGTGASTAASSGAFNLDRITIGDHAAFYQPFGWAGPIGEVIILTYNPTTTERQLIEGYLAWKWGTQASLPGGHPYAGAAPTTGGTAYSTTITASSIPIVGSSVSPLRAYTDTITASAVPIGGSSVSPVRNTPITLSASAVPITGAALAEVWARSVTITPSAVPIGGASITPVFSSVGGLTITPSSVPLTGLALSPLFNRTVAIASAAVPVVGQSIVLVYGRTLTITPSAVPIAGLDLTPTLRSPAVTIAITPATMAIEGRSVNLVFATKEKVSTERGGSFGPYRSSKFDYGHRRRPTYVYK